MKHYETNSSNKQAERNRTKRKSKNLRANEAVINKHNNNNHGDQTGLFWLGTVAELQLLYCFTLQ